MFHFQAVNYVLTDIFIRLARLMVKVSETGATSSTTPQSVETGW